MEMKSLRFFMNASLIVLSALVCGCGFVIGTKPNQDAPLPYANPIELPRGADGWTIFTPSPDSRIVYVSASAGEDDAGVAYLSSDPAIGPDPFHPSGAITPFRSYGAARAVVRDGYPDWILFHRGEIYADVLIEPRSGRSGSHMSLVGCYGSDSLPLPQLRPSEGEALIAGMRGGLAYFAVTDLDGYCASHDPAASPGALPPAAGAGINLVVGGGSIRMGLFEGLRLRFFAGNVIETYRKGYLGDIALRRCVILDDYSTLRNQGHSQGLFAGGVDGLFLEECVFDHNGWYSRDSTAGSEDLPGEATMFNHNTYIADCRDVTLKDNVFLRSSSIQNKFTANNGEASSSNVSVSGNLYVDGEIGISIGGNTEGPYRFKDVFITGNVFTEIGRSEPTGRGLAWYIEASDWDGGEISGNCLIHNTTPTVGNTFGLNVAGSFRDVLISDNVVYGLNESGNGPWGYSLHLSAGSDKENVVFRNNVFQEPSGPYYLVGLEDAASASGCLFRGNEYFVPSEGMPRAFIVGGRSYDMKRWRTICGDASVMEKVSFADPSRSIDSYQAGSSGAAGIDGFIAACRAQNRDAWDERYSARTVNAWLQAGFARP
jgi:hypothetical protein